MEVRWQQGGERGKTKDIRVILKISIYEEVSKRKTTLNDRRPGVVVCDSNNTTAISGDAIKLLNDDIRGSLRKLVEDERNGCNVVGVAG